MILVVDDTQTVLMFMKMMLRGYDIETATSGEDALKKIFENKPELIFLDIMMPGISGIEVCRILKSDPKTSDIKIVMLTTKGNPDMAKAAMIAGADAFETKPIKKPDLTRHIKSL